MITRSLFLSHFFVSIAPKRKSIRIKLICCYLFREPSVFYIDVWKKNLIYISLVDFTWKTTRKKQVFSLLSERIERKKLYISFFFLLFIIFLYSLTRKENYTHVLCIVCLPVCAFASSSSSSFQILLRTQHQQTNKNCAYFFFLFNLPKAHFCVN